MRLEEMEGQLGKPVTVESYRDAVQVLFDATKKVDTSGARVASLLLLGLYNGNEWHFNLSDLGLLDLGLYSTAITAIRGRFETYIEPHSLIQNGDDKFQALWRQWIRYHKDNVWKDQCGECWGSGMVYDDTGKSVGECRNCNGRGYLDPIEEMTENLKEIAIFSSKECRSDPIEFLKYLAKGALMRQGRTFNISS